jgi:hypothetical protein
VGDGLSRPVDAIDLQVVACMRFARQAADKEATPDRTKTGEAIIYY